MSSGLDQYMFISNTTAGRASNVQSYVQSRIRKVQWEKQYEPGSHTQRQRPECPKRQRREKEASATAESNRHIITKASKPKCKSACGVETELETVKAMIMQRAYRLSPNTASLSAPDPFASTAVQMPSFAWKFLKWPLTSFIPHIFRAESLDFRPKHRIEKDFRHVRAVQERLRLAVQDELFMASTLLYAASVLATWERGDIGERSLELFNLWTIKALRTRLAQMDRNIDPTDLGWVVLAIHSLSLAAMWAQDMDNALCHMSMNRELIQRVGIKSLSPYVREAILIGDKYLSVIRGQPAFATPLHWDVDCPIQVPYPSSDVYDESCFGRGLGAYLRQQGSEELNRTLQDILDCIRVASHTQSLETVPPDLGSWIFMRHLCLINWLIAYKPASATENCCCISMLVFLLLISLELGARARGRFQPTLDRLEDLIAVLKSKPPGESHREVLLWMAMTLAMAAQRWEWDSEGRYLQVIRQIVQRQDRSLEAEDLERIMQRHLYLGQLQNSAFLRVLSSLESETGSNSGSRSADICKQSAVGGKAECTLKLE